MEIFQIVLFAAYVLPAVLAQSSSNNTTSDYPELQPDWKYCLEFTWFGPDYDNATNRYNGTCSDYLEETRAEGIPCASPIVISDDGTKPNMDYLWENHKNSILCRRNQNQRCVKYTNYFNNQVNNITYMCAKVHYNTGGVPDGSSCYKQTLKGGYQSEICVCESSPGHRYIPCNAASGIIVSLGLMILCIFYQFYEVVTPNWLGII
ncbi:hypothetical protein JTB14_010946 [Gonioctena quinquepunctata]|nr:hypothetical protein JTB14_010946 [Gonioctena quinquepunctata]